MYNSEWKEDTREAKNGWCQGDYTGKCPICGEYYVGGKNSTQCADCAYKEDTSNKENTKISYGKYLQLDKYYCLGEALEEVCPELIINTPEIRMLKERLHWAKKNLHDAVYNLVDFEEE